VRRLWLRACAGLFLGAVQYALAGDPASPSPIELLRKADNVKLADHAEFTRLLKVLDDRVLELSSAEREYFEYLHGYSSAYDGDYDAAIAKLEVLQDTAKDVTVRFRAGAAVVNVLSLYKHYEEAYSRLNGLLGLLPGVTSGEARQQGLLVATFLYNEVGQYNLGLRYAQTIIDENWAGKGICRGGQVKLQALYKSRKIREVGSELQEGLDACARAGDVSFEYAILVDAAKVYLEQRKYDEAIALLKEHYDELVNTGYRRTISDYDALLAQAYRRKAPPMARKLAFDAIRNAVQNQFTEPLATAYGVLYELAKQEGDFKSALAFHEQYAVADKAYLDDTSARHLAYQKVSHENIANKLQIEALNKQNRVLQLQSELGANAVETGRLYITLLVLVVLFVGFWAYRTKRSQLRFMSLSQTDGLTGISNRPYFIEQAQKVLEYGRKSDQDASLIVCDLDHFKAINDRCGHAAGDFVLKRTVSVCREHLRKSDIFARFGGEEFAIVLPGCGIEEARQHAERLRTAIAAITVLEGVHKASVSASFGVAGTRASGYELWQLLAHADAALYRAKRAGRNRVVLYDITDEVGGLTAAAADAPVGPPDRSLMAN
jgi:diguanylate cyclase (GGDEF)-like protein